MMVAPGTLRSLWIDFRLRRHGGCCRQTCRWLAPVANDW